MSDLRKLDEEIALLRGWRRLRDVSQDELADLDYDLAHPETIATHWLSDDLSMEVEPPPFSSSWALAGPLLEEMGGPGAGFMWSARSADGRAAWVAGWRDADERSIGSAAYAAPCEAIARAWVAWRRRRA